MQFTISDYTAGEINPHITGISSGNVTGNGTKTSTIVASADNDDIVMYASAAFDAKIDDVSIKEVGLASGWTDADQQLQIPQTALQSYNQLAWFDGEGDRVSVTAFDFTTGQTINLWVNPAYLTTGRSILGTNDTENYILYKSGSETEIIRFEPDNNTQYEIDCGAAGVIQKDKWTMYTFLWNTDRTLDVYFNGELVGSSSATEDTTDGKTMKVSKFGQGLSSGDSDFIGAMTEISHYTDVLTQTEINDLYNDGKAKSALEASGNGGLSAYWRNNGLATWEDLKGSNDGAVTASETMLITAGADATRDSQGFLMNRQRLTNSLNTNEESYTTVDINNTFGTADFSYGFWFKLEDGENGYLVGVQSIGNSTGVGLTIDAGNGKIRSRPFGVTAVYTSAGYDNGEWHYAHHNIDRSANAILYIDGATAVLTQDISGVTGNSLSTNKWHIGAEVGTSGFLAGEIDDLIVYTDILTTAEITRNYNAGKRSHR